MTEIYDDCKDDFEICEHCEKIINCNKENIYIITKDDDDILWCTDCFDNLWKEYYKNGWRGDDIEYQLEINK